MSATNRNTNHIVTHGFSNPDSERLYKRRWPDDPKAKDLANAGFDCLSCNFFAPLNSDWGLCCYSRSKHNLETIFEHFTCSAFVDRQGHGATFSDHHLYSV